ncbi:unnamed protein product [Hermetia illucens]|uniref:HTH CENPB-type domain-containing protein n=1 Tax=Hermetia illucens TaxID=343691 RepID=A0A7R8YX62_HERIL|nr:unnamed protein product [Hermetia illucens]
MYLDFFASKGWFEKFKKRFNLQNTKHVGEAASADFESTARFPEGLGNLIREKGYLPDETVDIAESAKEIAESALKVWWKKPLPELSSAQPHISILCSNEIREVMDLAQQLGRERFTDFTEEELQKEVPSPDGECFSEEDLQAMLEKESGPTNDE